MSLCPSIQNLELQPFWMLASARHLSRKVEAHEPQSNNQLIPAGRRQPQSHGKDIMLVWEKESLCKRQMHNLIPKP